MASRPSLRPPRLAFLVAGSFFILAAPPSASAQYMYLDTDGDGIHTDADTIHPSGPTVADLWLHTNVNRDGTVVSCADAAKDIGISHFSFVLRVVGGTVAWGAFTPNATHPLPCVAIASDSTEFAANTCAPDWTPTGGLYRLGRLTLEIASGEPSLLFEVSSDLDPRVHTEFGTQCPSFGAYVPRFGTDWFDADGARYGGWTNPPTLIQPPTVVVSEHSATDHVLTATDPDGPEIAFSELSGPPFLSIGTASSTPGVSIGYAHIEPGYEDAGWYRAEVQVSDGVGSDFKSFRIYVANVDRAPMLDSIGTICVEQGATSSVTIHAIDADRDPVFVTARNLPGYARFTDGCAGCAYGRLDFDVPGDEPVGSGTLTVVASDGTLADSQAVAVRVTELGGCSGRAPLVGRVTPNPIRAGWGKLLFWTSKAGPLRVTLHDLHGRLVRTLFESSSAPAGYHQVNVDTEYRYYGPNLSAGVYFYRIEAAEGRSSGKLLIVR